MLHRNPEGSIAEHGMFYDAVSVTETWSLVAGMKATLRIALKQLDFLKPLFCTNVFERVDTLLRTMANENNETNSACHCDR